MGKRSWRSFFGRRPSLLDVGAFRERVVAAILADHPQAVFERPDEQGLLVTVDEVGPWTINCERFHGIYLKSPRDLEPLVRQLAASVGYEPSPATADALRVLVRPDHYVSEAESVTPRLTRPISRGLHAIVAVDGAGEVYFPDAATLQDILGMDIAAIWAVALDNTCRRLPDLELPPPDEVSIISCEEAESSGLLLLEDAWRGLEDATPDGLIVVALEKNVICVATPFSADAIPALQELIAVARTSVEHLSATPLTRRDGRWIEAEAVDPAFAPGGTRH